MSQLLDNPYFVALNRESDYTNTSFGTATPASDRRLLERRTFRNNSEGVENGISAYEARLQRRPLERDIDETLHGAEFGCNLYSYDMGDLRCRVDSNIAARAQFDVPCGSRPSLLLSRVQTPVDPVRVCRPKCQPRI
jgi:hypothetical protein